MIASRARAPAAWWIVVAGGLAAGTLDIVFAWTFWWLRAGVRFERIVQSVAAGLLGRASYAGGAATAALGLALHLSFATAMSVAYFVAARRYPVLARRWMPFGALYGLVLYGIMNYVVVPLSAATRGSDDPLWIGLGVGAHVFLIGMPIAFATATATRVGSAHG